MPDLIPQARLRFMGSAQRMIGKICLDKREKRALCKALRDNFHWRDSDYVTLSADFGRDFYFTDDCGMRGGLCRHESTVRGKDGKAYTAVKYSIHT